MIACSYGKTGRHNRFTENVNGAHAVGLKVGAYHYDYSTTVEDAIENAKNCKAAIEEAGVLLELPVFYDLEDADDWKRNHGLVLDCDEDVYDADGYDAEAIFKLFTEMTQAFVSELGLDCGVYSSASWLDNFIDWKNIGCAVWNAGWGENDSIKGYMWQYTNKLVIGDKEFDGNILY